MKRLVNYDPQMIDLGDRRGLGFLFRCVTGHCHEMNIVLFANPLDGGVALEGSTWEVFDKLRTAGLIDDDKRRLHRGCGSFRWQRDPKTTSFDNLTLTPSVNAHECGHFMLTNGNLTMS